MLKIKRILVPRDFSTCSEHALVHALDLARRTGAELHTVFAEVLHGGTYAEQVSHSWEVDQLHRQLEQLPEMPDSDRPLTEGLTIHHAVIREIAAAPAILAYAEDHDIDVIVMGTHGRRGWRRLLLGSVAEEVVRLAPCPVYTIREAVAPVQHAQHTLLVPIDYSQYSLEALRVARELAVLYGASLDLLHVIEDRLHPSFYNPSVFSAYDMQPEIEQKALLHLRQMVDEAEGPAVEVRYHVGPGHPSEEIVRFAETHQADLIVMSTHGLTGLEHFFIGSVAEKVTRAAPCPVLTVKAFHKSILADPSAQAASALS